MMIIMMTWKSLHSGETGAGSLVLKLKTNWVNSQQLVCYKALTKPEIFIKFNA